MTSPGRVPYEEPWKSIHSPSVSVVETKKRNGNRRICRWCNVIKPDRCHHCRECNECTLKMDHHCPWLDNCIGWGNHKYFILVLYYASQSLLFLCASGGWMAYWILHWSPRDSFDSARAGVCIILSSVTGLLSVVIGLFFSIHLTMILKGLTTIEVFEAAGETDCCLAALCCPAVDEPQPSPYRLPSRLDNIKAALGDDWWLWWAPTPPKRKTGSVDGTIFTVNNEQLLPLIKNT
jgi:hypothetical protein